MVITGRRFARRVVRGIQWRFFPSPPPGKSFPTEILRRYQVSSADEVTDITVRMWIDFALSSITRGEHVVAALGGGPAFLGKRVLDVGCAYGGFLVAAKMAGAKAMFGIDISSDLIGLARRQIADYRVTALLLVDDVTSDGIADRLGTFDIVICNDVIEHVVEPAVCAANLASLLRPGGRVFLEIPNGSAVEFIRRDGHYGLFGITLLDRIAAEEWWRHHYGPNDAYGVEHYAPLSYYLEIFSKAGLALRLLNAPNGDAVAGVSDLEAQFDALEVELAEAAAKFPNAPSELVDEMRRRGADEIAEFRRLLARYRRSVVRAEQEVLAATLFSTYKLTFWELVGQRG